MVSHTYRVAFTVGTAAGINYMEDCICLPEIIEEVLLATYSEREHRAVDQDREDSMEEKKREGYF